MKYIIAPILVYIVLAFILWIMYKYGMPYSFVFTMPFIGAIWSIILVDELL